MIAHIRDIKSFWGGIAFLLTGTVLSVAVALYFLFPTNAVDIFKSRILWEVALNIQILNIALLWFAFDSRLEQMAGPWKLRAIVNLVFAVLVNCAPVAVFFYITYYISNDRFPTADNVVSIVYGFVVLWLLFEAIVFIILRYIIKTEQHVLRPRLLSMSRLWPACIMLTLLVSAWMSGQNLLYIAIPFFGYLQGANDYFGKAIRGSIHYDTR